MFTDLIDSTGLADSMDPEDFRVLIEAHRTIAVTPIARYGGVVARYLGDGMLVLFGYPEAHEDDPERAVRAGLEVAAATAKMNQRWVGEGRGRIAVRIGVHTGIVVVGDVLKADVRESMAVFGNAPSIASRLQALAKPDGVVLSGATKALLPPAILCETRGNTVLRGLSRPLEVFAALGVREGQGDRRVGGRMLPFVNREKELSVIRRHWPAVRRGEGRCIVIEGDPGIGKSRLIRAVEERIVTKPSRWLITRTSPYAANTDFYAFAELFRQALPISDRTKAGAGEAFGHLKGALKGQGLGNPEIAIGLAVLLGIGIPENATTMPLQPERARELTLRAITTWLRHEANRQPLVLVIEDLHWADASTLEAIERLKHNLAIHSLFLIGTTRTSLTGGAGDTAGAAAQPGDGTALDSGGNRGISTDAVATTTKANEAWSSKPARANPADAVSTTMRLERLGTAYAEDLLGHVLRGVELPKNAVTTLLERANGVPLYLEELPKPVLEAGGEGAPTVELPATLRDSLMAQLDGMGEAKVVAQTAAVLGHSFERPLLEHVWEGDGDTLQSGLAALTDAALILPEGETKTGTYGFRHALLAEVAYESLLRDERRHVHRRTAETLVKHFRPLSEAHPEFLAFHYEAAGKHVQAFESWMKAGKAAAERSANKEAIEHFKRAKSELAKLGAAGNVDVALQELQLLLATGPVQIALYGWSSCEVDRTYQQALSISNRLGSDSNELFNAWRGIYNVHLLRGELKVARVAVDHLRKFADDHGDHKHHLAWRTAAGVCDFLMGSIEQAHDHMSNAIQLFSMIDDGSELPDLGTDPAVIAYSFSAWSQWMLGESKLSKQISKKAIIRAEEVGHPFSLGYALCLASSLAQCSQDRSLAKSYAESALELSLEQSFPYWRAWATIIKGWALATSTDPDEGLALLRDGIAQYEATDASQMRGYSLCLLAEAYKEQNDWDNVWSAANAALEETGRTGISFYQPEALRLAGEGAYRINRRKSPSLHFLIRSFRLAEQQLSCPLLLSARNSLHRAFDDHRLRTMVDSRAEGFLRNRKQFMSPFGFRTAWDRLHGDQAVADRYEQA